MAPSGERYEVKEGVVCFQVKLCDPHLSALEVRFSRWGAIQIYTFTFTFTFIPYDLWPSDLTSRRTTCVAECLVAGVITICVAVTPDSDVNTLTGNVISWWCPTTHLAAWLITIWARTHTHHRHKRYIQVIDTDNSEGEWGALGCRDEMEENGVEVLPHHLYGRASWALRAEPRPKTVLLLFNLCQCAK